MVKRLYEAFERRDSDALRDLCHPDLTIQLRAEVPEGPITFHGLEGAEQIWQALDATFEDYRAEPVETTFRGNRAVVHCRLSGGLAGGHRLEDDIFHVWQFRDGRAAAMSHHSTRSEALAAAGISE